MRSSLLRFTSSTYNAPMRDAVNLSDPRVPDPQKTSEPPKPSAFQRFAALFGFGLLNPKIMVYALGTFLLGLGLGISIDSWVRTGSVLSDWLAWSGLALAILGNVIGNLSHGSMKKEARRKLETEAQSGQI